MRTSCRPQNGPRLSRRARLNAAAVTAVVVGLLVVVAASVAAGLPVLAGPWGRGQEGYGHVKPHTIFNGGDPTGLINGIHWTSWGGEQAIGSGTALWVGPHQSVAQGHPEHGAKVVLFQLGRCHGKPAYDAIEWFFPRHRQRFSPGTYINACTGKYYFNGRRD